MRKNKNFTLIGIFAIICAIVFGGIFLTRNVGKSEKKISKESAVTQLAKMVKKIDPSESEPVKSPIDYDTESTVAEELPDIDTCDVTTKATTELYAEIFASPEKAGEGTDGWMCEMAEAFNRKGYEVDGNPVSVQIRKVNSGQALDYISSGKAVPDGYSPSAMFWADMLNAKGVETETVSEKLVGNVAGIVLSKDAYKKVTEACGSVDMKAITDMSDEIAFGYTNPFASSSGLNFLISTLERYDGENPLSETAAQGFQTFQSNVPLVSLTTMQMRNAAEKGTLDGFIMEYQSYINDSSISKEYQFTPYGYRHDNPLVALSSASAEKKEILKLFCDFCSSKDAQNRASEYGFNQKEDYTCEYAQVSGDTLLKAQDFYKTNKDGGREVIAVFVTDVSGSMQGEPINMLQKSLINSMRYISSDNCIGLVSYSDDVSIDVPIKQFDMEQQTLFKGAVEHLYANGSTATYDGICVALDMINQAMKDHPNAKPMIFVLSDGETNRGYGLNDIKGILSGLQVPVYTIGYNANIEALKSISAINEAATIDASTDDVIYQLKQLFNANM